jgi:hypothetical protein
MADRLHDVIEGQDWKSISGLKANTVYRIRLYGIYKAWVYFGKTAPTDLLQGEHLDPGGFCDRVLDIDDVVWARPADSGGPIRLYISEVV